MAGAGVPVPSVDDGAIVVAPQACFKVESHENGVVIHLQRGGPRRSWGLRGLEEMQGRPWACTWGGKDYLLLLAMRIRRRTQMPKKPYRRSRCSAAKKSK